MERLSMFLQPSLFCSRSLVPSYNLQALENSSSTFRLLQWAENLQVLAERLFYLHSSWVDHQALE